MLPEVIKVDVRATNRQIPSSGFFPPELTTRLWHFFGLLGDVTFLSRFPRTSWLEPNTPVFSSPSQNGSLMAPANGWPSAAAQAKVPDA